MLKKKTVVYIVGVVPKEGNNKMAYYAGQILYCIDENHPLYGKQVKITTPLYEAEDGTPAISDIKTGKELDLKIHQISVYQPIINSVNKKSLNAT